MRKVAWPFATGADGNFNQRINQRFQANAGHLAKYSFSPVVVFRDTLPKSIYIELPHVGYLKDNDCQRGIYLIGWFQCAQWDETDARKKATPSWDIQQARAYFAKQAEDLSNQQISLRSAVLNTSLR